MWSRAGGELVGAGGELGGAGGELVGVGRSGEAYVSLMDCAV